MSRMLFSAYVICLVLVPVISQEQCAINKEVFVKDASIFFGFAMSMRKTEVSSTTSSPACTLMSREPLQNYLAAEWVVERINAANNGTGYIPGVKVGFFGLDDCRSPMYASRQAMSFLDSWIPNPLKNCTTKNESLHIGIVGPSRSTTATRVASLLRDVKIPIISMSATSAGLSNTTNYPTFFRTVLSDVHQMNLTIDILDKLNWTYVAVVHDDDEYGLTGTQVLRNYAKKKGICITETFSFSLDVSTLKDRLMTLIQNAKDNSIALVLIGSRDSAESFLRTIDTRIPYPERNGFRIILSESTNTDISVFDRKTFGVGTLAIGTTSIFLDDLHKDLLIKVKNVKSGILRHPLIEKYNNDFPNEELILKDSLDTFVPPTVHAVFALVEALKVQHKQACAGMPGICTNLITAINKGQMLSGVRNVHVDYGSMEPGVPPENYRLNNYSFSFDDNGDIQQENQMPSYAIYQYGSDKKYEQIGAYIDSKTQLNMSKIKMLTQSGNFMNGIPSSVCASNCVQCLNDGKVPIVFLEGVAYIVGVFSMHESADVDPFKCDVFRSVANDAIVAEGFLYAIQDLRKTTGIEFGAIGIDDCYSGLRSVSILSDYFSGIASSSKDIFSHLIPREKLVGVVGCRSSGCTVPTAMFLMPMNVPVISYASSSPDLDDKITYPRFLRTVPSDIYQAKVILKILQLMKWEYVGLLYVKNNYGAKGMQAFKELAMNENSGVCVAEEIGIAEKAQPSDNRDFFNVWQKLTSQSVKVVVFFGIDVRYRAFLKYLETDGKHGDFIFVGSEDWGINSDILNSGNKSARGSLTLRMEEIKLESEANFKDYLSKKTPMANDLNIWYQEFWQNLFQCNFRGGFINTFKGECDPSWRLSEAEVKKRVTEQRLVHVMTAVYALGRGLVASKKMLCENVFPCKFLGELSGEVVEKIKVQTRKEGNSDVAVFDKDGNGAIGFEVYNIQFVESSNTYEYVRVGTFNSRYSNLFTEKLKFYTKTFNLISEIPAKCTTYLCDHCQKAEIRPADENKGTNIEAGQYRQPDILVISLIVVLILAVLVAIAVLMICLKKKYQGLEKKLEKDQIYDEPDRNAYQQYVDSHGIRFANLAFNPYLASSGNIEGVSNPNFINDNIDSVSQVVAMRSQQYRHSQPDLRNRIQNNSMSPAVSSQFNSHYSSRPLPVIQGDTLSNVMQDNHAYQESLSEDEHGKHPSRSVHTGQRHYNSSIPSDVSADNVNSGQDSQAMKSAMFTRAIPASSINPNNASDIVYYMQGADGQLAAHINSPGSDIVPTSQQNLQLQRSSVRSKSSFVDSSYGPYSTALAQQRRQQVLQQQRQVSNTQTISPIHHHNTPDVTNYNGQNVNVHATSPSESNTVIYTSTQPQAQWSQPHDSPVHYAYPTSHSQTMTNPSHFRHPSLQKEEKENRLAALTPHSMPTVKPGHENQLEGVYQGTQPAQQARQQEVEETDQSPGPSRHSIGSLISSSIPDVVGQTSPMPDFQRNISFDSVELSSSKESLDNLDQATNHNSRFVLSTLSALGGNVTNV